MLIRLEGDSGSISIDFDSSRSASSASKNASSESSYTLSPMSSLVASWYALASIEIFSCNSTSLMNERFGRELVDPCNRSTATDPYARAMSARLLNVCTVATASNVSNSTSTRCAEESFEYRTLARASTTMNSVTEHPYPVFTRRIEIPPNVAPAPCV